MRASGTSTVQLDEEAGAQRTESPSLPFTAIPAAAYSLSYSHGVGCFFLSLCFQTSEGRARRRFAVCYGPSSGGMVVDLMRASGTSTACRWCGLGCIVYCVVARPSTSLSCALLVSFVFSLWGFPMRQPFQLQIARE